MVVFEEYFKHIQGRIQMLLSNPIIAFPYVTINQQDSKIAFKLYSLHIGYQTNRQNILAGPSLYLLNWNFNSPVFSQYNLTPQILLQTYMESYKEFIGQLSSLLIPYMLSSRIRDVNLVYALLNDNLQGYVPDNKNIQPNKHYSIAKDLLLIVDNIYSRIHKQEPIPPCILYSISLTNSNKPLYQIELIHNPISNIQIGKLTNLIEKLDRQNSPVSTGLHLLTVQQSETVHVLIHKYSVYNRATGWETRLVPTTPMHTYDLNTLSVLDESFLTELKSQIKIFTEIDSSELKEFAEKTLNVKNRAYIDTTTTTFANNKSSNTYTTSKSIINKTSFIKDDNAQVQITDIRGWQEGTKHVVEYTVRVEIDTATAQINTDTKNTKEASEKQETVETVKQETELPVEEVKETETLDSKLVNETDKEDNKDKLDFDSLFS